MRRLIALLALFACAQQGFPPGGPPDKDPPKLLKTTPDTSARNVTAKEVDFQYDEVLTERPAGASSLDALVLISPRDGAPRVGWHRTRISVRGHKDWKPNTTYTVEILPGISDLRGNADKAGFNLVFSTGPEIAGKSISGVVFDWPAGHPAPNAIIEAVSHPDSTVYIAKADSVGRFSIIHMPPGTFTVFGWIDANNNHDRDQHEAQDSAAVTLQDTASVELLTFIHDSIGPHIVTVEVRDSLTIHATFDKPVDPKQPLDSAHFILHASDSSLVPIKTIVSAREIDKQRNDSASRADSIRARTDTAFRRQYQASHRVPTDTSQRNAQRRAAVLAAMLPSKPIPISDILIKVGSPLKPGAQYKLESRDIHNLMGVAALSVRTFDVPKPQPPPPPPKNGAAPRGGKPGPPAARTGSARADSARADSARAKPAVPLPDTTRKQPPA
ncbi:MAG TPA: Ig-like domain-containing protein [Gemmatimonadaceae bacterium]|nr:Ig-like domain-containing protein [Gemmatimonadaceae bacterium]